MQAAKNWCDEEKVKKLGIWMASKQGDGSSCTAAVGTMKGSESHSGGTAPPPAFMTASRLLIYYFHLQAQHRQKRAAAGSGRGSSKFFKLWEQSMALSWQKRKPASYGMDAGFKKLEKKWAVSRGYKGKNSFYHQIPSLFLLLVLNWPDSRWA